MRLTVKELKQAKADVLFSKTVAIRAQNIKARISDESGKKKYIIIVKFSDYKSIDDERDLMLRGAFDDSIRESENSNRKIAFCWQHDRKDPIGRITKIWDDEEGAYVEVELSDFDAVKNAKRAWYQIQEGVINQASFGFKYVWDAMRYIEEETSTLGESYFAIGKVELYEISLVTLGCNPNTEVLDYQEAEKSLFKSFLSRENVKKALLALNAPEIDEVLKQNNIEVPERKRGIFERI